MASEKPLTVSEMARLGGHARARKLGKARLVQSAKKAAEARWAKAKSEIKQEIKRAQRLNRDARKLAKQAKKKANG